MIANRFLEVWISSTKIKLNLMNEIGFLKVLQDADYECVDGSLKIRKVDLVFRPKSSTLYLIETKLVIKRSLGCWYRIRFWKLKDSKNGFKYILNLASLIGTFELSVSLKEAKNIVFLIRRSLENSRALGLIWSYGSGFLAIYLI